MPKTITAVIATTVTAIKIHALVGIGTVKTIALDGSNAIASFKTLLYTSGTSVKNAGTPMVLIMPIPKSSQSNGYMITHKPATPMLVMAIIAVVVICAELTRPFGSTSRPMVRIKMYVNATAPNIAMPFGRVFFKMFFTKLPLMRSWLGFKASKNAGTPFTKNSTAYRFCGANG